MDTFPPLHQPPPPPPARENRAGSRGLRPAALLALVIALGLGVILFWRALAVRPGPASTLDPAAMPRPVVPRGDLADDEQATIELFKNRSPSVVFITTAEMFRDGVSFNVLEIPRGAGTGVVWDTQGHILTNYHVIEGASRARVTLGDKVWDASLTGTAPDKDLAVLKIDAPSDVLRPVLVGSSQDLQVGQKVFAIGNPFGLDQTLTTGVISGLGREIKARTGRIIQDVIQTDAAINPGNSGGPLLDSAGRLIGINTAIFSPSGAYAGVGFAIPVDTVNRIVPQIIRHGRVVRPGFGILIAPDHVVEQLGLEGVLVREVQPDSAAAVAGMLGIRRDADDAPQFGDIIIAVDGKKIRNGDDLFRALDQYKVGDTVEVEILRNARTADARTEKMSVTLQSLP